MTSNQTTEITDLERLELSVRARNSLKMDGILSVEQVRILGHRGLLKLPTLGRKAANEVWAAVQGIVIDGDITAND